MFYNFLRGALSRLIAKDSKTNQGSIGDKEMKKYVCKKTLHSFLLMLMLGLSGCALGSAVQPWEKETLARPEMTFEGDKLDKAYTEHIYSSKEAASGGSGVGGGGCGCN